MAQFRVAERMCCDRDPENRCEAGKCVDSTLWNQLGVDVEPAAQIELHIRILLLPTTSQQMPTVPELHNCTQQMSPVETGKASGWYIYMWIWRLVRYM